MLRRFFRYLTSSVEELKKVIWPSRLEVLRHTFVIAVSVIVTIVVLGLLDYGLTELLRIVIVNRE